nr:hypothetical protein RKE32_12135 [Streptomyces sp. Li-HN-5-13]
MLAGLYAVLTAALLLGTSIWAAQSRSSAAGVGGFSLRDRDALGWSLPSVLVACALWALLGALVVPAVLDAVRGTPVPPAAPAAPAVPPAPSVPPMPVVPPLPGQTVADTLAHGSVEPVADLPPTAAVAADAGGDPHAAYRRPDAG